MGDQRRFRQSLEIDGQIVALGAQFLFGASPGARIVAAEDHDAIHETVAFEQRNPGGSTTQVMRASGKLCLSDAAPGREWMISPIAPSRTIRMLSSHGNAVVYHS